jgi:hypothetical protein
MCNAGLSRTAFYSSIYKGIDAINGGCQSRKIIIARALPESFSHVRLSARPLGNFNFPI